MFIIRKTTDKLCVANLQCIRTVNKVYWYDGPFVIVFRYYALPLG